MGKDYNIAKTAAMCCKCAKELPPDTEMVATICEGQDEFIRQDYCVDCWQQPETDDSDETATDADNAADTTDSAQATAIVNPKIFGSWRTRVPQPLEKKKLFIDDELLINFFERLAGSEEPARVNFRFVLALILMRKKLLIYDKLIRSDDSQETWQMHLKGSSQNCEVINPRLDDDQIADVSSQLGQIMEGDL